MSDLQEDVSLVQGVTRALQNMATKEEMLVGSSLVLKIFLMYKVRIVGLFVAGLAFCYPYHAVKPAFLLQ